MEKIRLSSLLVPVMKEVMFGDKQLWDLLQETSVGGEAVGGKGLLQ